MSIVLTRSPLEPIGMNGGGVQKRRSARLSQEGSGENEPPAKKTKVNGASTATVTTKQADGSSKSAGKRKRKEYDEEVEGFTFSKGRRGKGKETKEPPVRNSLDEKAAPEAVAPPTSDEPVAAPPAPVTTAPVTTTAPPSDEVAPKTAQKKTRRRLPTTPEPEVVEKPIRRSKRLSDEKAPEKEPQQSPKRPSHAKSHANTNHERSPSPEKARPVTVEKKRKHGANGVEEEKVMMISLPFADTPVIRRNKEMRKTSAEGNRRSSAGMRGRRASSMIDEGRGHEASKGSPHLWQANEDYDRAIPSTQITSTSISEPLALFADAKSITQVTSADETSNDLALPHAEVPTSEFFKHISADLTEPRRMRCLLGWCGTRSLPSKPDPPKESNPGTSLEFQALQAARIIQEELSQDLVTNGTLSDWFSRDESVPPQIPLRKKPNPRNVANTAKAEELERELERLKQERAEWDEVIQSAPTTSSHPDNPDSAPGELSPLRQDVLDTPQRAIFEQLHNPASDTPTDPETLQQRLRNISDDLEFAVDQFAHGVHALATTKETAERVAERSLSEAAKALEERDKERTASGKAVDQMDALRGLARVLNAQYR